MPTSRREFRTQNRNCQHGRSMSAPTAGDEGLCKKTEAATFVAASVFAGELRVPLYVGGGARPKPRGIDASERHRAQALPVEANVSRFPAERNGHKAGLLTFASTARARPSRSPNGGLSSLRAASAITAAAPFGSCTRFAILRGAPGGRGGTLSRYSIFTSTV